MVAIAVVKIVALYCAICLAIHTHMQPFVEFR